MGNNVVHLRGGIEGLQSVTTNIICIHGMYVVKTGLVFKYEHTGLDMYEEGEYSYSEEIIDVCTGKHYGFDGLIHLVGNPVNVYIKKNLRSEIQDAKRGKHSRSNNKRHVNKR